MEIATRINPFWSSDILTGNQTELYGGEPDAWFHSSGYGWAFYPPDGRIKKAELHWAEEPSAGIHEMRIKRWAD